VVPKISADKNQAAALAPGKQEAKIKETTNVMDKKELLLRKYIQIYRPLLKREKRKNESRKTNPILNFKAAA